jgi:hypothetical protein
METRRQLREKKEKAKLTRTVHHIQPICHSIHERNPTKAQLEQEETIQSQIWKLTLQIKNLTCQTKKCWTGKKDTGTSKADNQSAIACHQLAQVKNFRLGIALANIISIMQINIYQ